jgi:hypothetical protein
VHARVAELRYNAGVPRCAVVLLVLASCVDRGAGPQAKKIDPGYVRDNVLTQVPEDLQRVDVSLGGKVTYLGSRLVSIEGKPLGNTIAPGGMVRVLHYWQVVQPVGPGWKLFRYARGAAGTADFMNFGPTDMELGLPPAKWKAGQIIQDAQDIVLRPDWRSPFATIFVGLVAEGRHQLGDRMTTDPATAATVADRAIVARTLEVDLSKAPPPPGTVHVPHAAGEIVIDGVANEPGWATGVMSSELVTADGSPEPVGKAIARMTWDERNLYVFVQVTDTDIYSQYKVHDEPIWKQDVVELFIDADGNRRGYVELQVNPNNTTFDSYFATTRAQPGDETWTSNMVTAVKVRGTADKAGDADQGWDVEIAIPWDAARGRDQAMQVRTPPQVGDRWKLNVVRVDYRSNGGSPGVSSWNRITYGDFHALDRMLQVVFADQTGAITVAQPQPQPEGAVPAGSGSGSNARGSATTVIEGADKMPAKPMPANVRQACVDNPLASGCPGAGAQLAPKPAPSPTPTVAPPAPPVAPPAPTVAPPTPAPAPAPTGATGALTTP